MQQVRLRGESTCSGSEIDADSKPIFNFNRSFLYYSVLILSLFLGYLSYNSAYGLGLEKFRTTGIYKLAQIMAEDRILGGKYDPNKRS